MQQAQSTGKRLKLAFLFTVLIATLLYSSVPLAHATFTLYVEGYNETEGSSVAVEVSMDSVVVGDTPQTIVDAGSHYLNVETTDTFGDNFQGWLYNGYLYIDNTLYISDSDDEQTVTAIYSTASSPPNGTSGIGNYTFIGLNEELSGNYLGSVYVTAFYTVAGRSPERFLVAGQYGYNTSVQPQYFHFELGDYDREYWLAPNENDINIYILNSTFTQYTINFLDSAGVLNDYPFVAAKGYINGSLVTLQKEQVDSVGNINLNLVNGFKYTLTLDSGSSEITFGDVVMTSATGVQLILKAIYFPKETLLTYRYMHIYPIRNGTDITINFEDTQNNTSNVDLSIVDSDGAEQYSSTQSSQTFSVTWSSAVANESYTVSASVNHTVYGVLDYSWYLVGTLDFDAEPFSLAFLGEIPNVNTAYLIPALLALFAAACFSVLSLEVGILAFLCVATIERMFNWLPIPMGLLVAGWALGLLAVLMLARRRINE